MWGARRCARPHGTGRPIASRSRVRSRKGASATAVGCPNPARRLPFAHGDPLPAHPTAESARARRSRAGALRPRRRHLRRTAVDRPASAATTDPRTLGRGPGLGQARRSGRGGVAAAPGRRRALAALGAAARPAAAGADRADLRRRAARAGPAPTGTTPPAALPPRRATRLARRRRRAAAPTRTNPGSRPRSTRAPARIGEGSPRNAIVATWVRLEQAVEGEWFPHRPEETPSELVERALSSYHLDGDAIRRLAALYREARFSTHPVTEDHRLEAADCLRRLLATIGSAAR